METDRLKGLLQRWKALKGKRGNWENHWEDLASVMLPRRMGFVTTVVPGDRRTDDVFDGTPAQAARGLANAIGWMMWPEGEKNIFIKANEDRLDNSDEAKEWFSDVAARMARAMANPKARYRQARGEVDQDLAVFGTGVIYSGERQRGGLLYQSLHLKDALVLFSEEGEPEGMFRSKTFTVRQAETRFGRNKLSAATQKLLSDQQYDKEIEFLHAIVPRAEGFAGALLAKNLPFASIWIEIAEVHEAEVSGFHEFPFAVPRWDTSSGEDYGRSPGMIALPDASTLQAMGETILIAGQRAAAPPLLVPSDGFFDGANSFPDGLTYYDAELAKEMGRIPIGPLDTGANLPISRDMQQDMRQQVFAAFFRNVLNLPVEGPQMTAEEIRARKEEFIREIGPVFGRLESDYNGPLVERTFNIMLRAGALPPIPEILQGQQIRFEYESPVKKIRQQIEAAGARMWVQERLELAKATQDESHLDLVDFDAFGRVTAEAAGVPQKIVVGAEKVAAKRQARLKAQQEAAQQQQAAQMVDMAAQAGKIPGVQQAIEGAA